MTIWDRLRRGLVLPFRFPALLALSIGYTGLLYASGSQADILDINSPYWVLSVASVLLLSPIYHALLLPAIASALRGERSDPRRALEGSQRLFPRLFLGEVVVAAAVIAGGLLLVVPGVYFGMRLIYYKQSIVFQRTATGDALRESYRMTRDGRSTIRLFCCLGALYGGAVGLDWLLVAVAPGLGVHVGAVLGTGLLLAWMNVFVTLSYIERSGGKA